MGETERSSQGSRPGRPPAGGGESLDAHWVEPMAEPIEDVDDPIALAVARLLAEEGPLSEAELRERLAADGLLDRGDEAGAHAALRGAPRVFPLRDGRLVHLPSTAEGLTFTHRVTAAELADGRLASLPDFALYLTFLPPLELAGGGEVIERYWRGPFDPERDASLFGPPGWLPDRLAPGDLVAFRVEAGALTVEAIDEGDLDEAASAEAAEALRETFDRLDGRNDAGGPIDEPELVLEAVARHPGAWRATVAPVAELLAAAGLDGGLGTVVDPEAPDERPDPAWEAFLRDTYGLDAVGVEAVTLLTETVELLAELDAEELQQRAALVALPVLARSPEVVSALADLSLGIDGAGLEALERLVALLEPAAQGTARAPVAYLAARCAEWRGDPIGGEAALRRAVAADEDFEPAHEDLAWFAEDRGDAAAALGHLRDAGVPDDDAQAERLRQRQARRPSAGRNDPCPCGSGVKHKRCCARTGGPLPDRVAGLLEKMFTYVRRPPQRGATLALVEARAGDATDEDRLARAIGDGVVLDTALFEGGMLEGFLADRGPLLPDDEAELAASWVGIRRSLHEIVDARPGEGLELLDLRSGDRVRVRERAASATLEVGQALLARVVPDGQGHQLAAGVVRVPVAQREGLLDLLDGEPSAVALCAWVAALEAPPRMVTMEGEDVVACTARYRVADPTQAAEALAGRYEAAAGPAGERSREFVEWIDVGGAPWIRATLTLEGAELRLDASAEERLERVKAVVEEVVDGVELLEETRQPLDELRAQAAADAEAEGESPGRVLRPGDDDMPEEVREAVEEHLRRYEARWVDEPVPALDGLTPRQALADPTRRDRVLALIDEMEGFEASGGMSAARVRALLGLDGA